MSPRPSFRLRVFAALAVLCLLWAGASARAWIAPGAPDPERRLEAATDPISGWVALQSSPAPLGAARPGGLTGLALVPPAALRPLLPAGVHPETKTPLRRDDARPRVPLLVGIVELRL